MSRSARLLLVVFGVTVIIAGILRFGLQLASFELVLFVGVSACVAAAFMLTRHRLAPVQPGLEDCLRMSADYLEQGRLVEAAVTAKRAAACAPGDFRATLALARVHLEGKEYVQAQRLIRSVLSREPANSEANEMLRHSTGSEPMRS